MMPATGSRRREIVRELADRLPQALWIAEGDTLCYVNPSCRSLTGLRLAPDEPAAKLCDAVHPQDRPTLLGYLRHPRNADFACRLSHPDGSIVRVRIRIFAIDASPRRPLCAGMMEDITGIETHERRLNDVVSTVSHELRTSLTSISASLALLSGNPAWQLPPAARRLLAIAHANSERLVRLVSNILDIETIERGSSTFERKRVNIGVLVEQAIDANRDFAATLAVRIRLAEASACEVNVDPDRFMQVMTNLLSNAAKFSPPGGEVEVAIASQPGNVIISVRDHGPGIPEEFKPRVFERFARAATSEPRHNGGSGLGLSIAKEIVVRHGGTLSFADAPGGGALFRIMLPPATRANRAANGADEKEVA